MDTTVTVRDDSKVRSVTLYEASRKGCVETLNSLIEEDKLILSKISLNPFPDNQTPLHISSLLGRLHFTEKLLNLNPKLASELDSDKRSPLHLAAAEGHQEIAKALLSENRDVCLAKDKYGRIPLHYAAMNGRVDLIQLLIGTRHEAVFELLPSGETALHLCVLHNHLEALRLFVESAAGLENTDEFLNKKALEGDQDTILHLAVKLKQVETVEYLLSVPGVKVDTLNRKGYKASDLLHHLPKDFNTPRIQSLICINKRKPLSWWGNWIIERLILYKREWKKEMSGSIMVAATLISTTTFQTAINPPGGVWQETTKDADIDPEHARFECNISTCIAGTSILAHAWPADYYDFMMYNSIAFLASLSVILLVVGGIPLKNRVCMWLLTLSICVTLMFMALTFLKGMYLVTPYHELDSTKHIYHMSFKVGLVLFALICAYHTIHLFIWVFKRLYGRGKILIRHTAHG